MNKNNEQLIQSILTNMKELSETLEKNPSLEKSSNTTEELLELDNHVDEVNSYFESLAKYGE